MKFISAASQSLIFLVLISVSMATAQTYPATNPTNNAPGANPNGPVPYQGTLPDGSTLIENGLQPGAQTTFYFTQGTGSAWTQSQIDTVESSITNALEQAWPGAPFVAFPAPTFVTDGTAPPINSTTGYNGADPSNFIQQLLSSSDATMTSKCPTCKNIPSDDTFNTNDENTGYSTSAYTFIDTGVVAPSDLGGLADHVFGHGALNLTDTTSNTSAMYDSDKGRPSSFTQSDLSTIHDNFEHPAPPPSPPPCE